MLKTAATGGCKFLFFESGLCEFYKEVQKLWVYMDVNKTKTKRSSSLDYDHTVSKGKTIHKD